MLFNCKYAVFWTFREVFRTLNVKLITDSSKVKKNRSEIWQNIASLKCSVFPPQHRSRWLSIPCLPSGWRCGLCGAFFSCLPLGGGPEETPAPSEPSRAACPVFGSTSLIPAALFAPLSRKVAQSEYRPTHSTDPHSADPQQQPGPTTLLSLRRLHQKPT